MLDTLGATVAFVVSVPPHLQSWSCHKSSAILPLRFLLAGGAFHRLTLAFIRFRDVRCSRAPGAVRPGHRVLDRLQLQHPLPRRPVDPRPPRRHRHVKKRMAAPEALAARCSHRAAAHRALLSPPPLNVAPRPRVSIRCQPLLQGRPAGQPGRWTAGVLCPRPGPPGM